MSSIVTTQYIRKPLFVDAVRVTGANFDEIAAWCQGKVQKDDEPDGTGKKFVRVRVHNPKNPRQTKAFVGDWLLYTERGYKVYTNQAFRASFNVVTPEETQPQSQDLVRGTEEVLPGVSLNEAVIWLRKQPDLTLEQISSLVRSGEVCSFKEQNIGVHRVA